MHLHHSGAFENYDWKKQNLKEEKKRRETTEKDILPALELLLR